MLAHTGGWTACGPAIAMPRLQSARLLGLDIAYPSLSLRIARSELLSFRVAPPRPEQDSSCHVHSTNALYSIDADAS